MKFYSNMCSGCYYRHLALPCQWRRLISLKQTSFCFVPIRPLHAQQNLLHEKIPKRGLFLVEHILPFLRQDFQRYLRSKKLPRCLFASCVVLSLSGTLFAPSVITTNNKSKVNTFMTTLLFSFPTHL